MYYLDSEWIATALVRWWWSESQKLLARDQTRTEWQGLLLVQDFWNKKMPAFLKTLGMLVSRIQYGKPCFAPFYSCHLIWVHHYNLQKSLSLYNHIQNKFIHNHETLDIQTAKTFYFILPQQGTHCFQFSITHQLQMKQKYTESR